MFSSQYLLHITAVFTGGAWNVHATFYEMFALYVALNCLCLQHQCLCRQSAAWKDSLRFRTPQMSQMPGLRRVTLNLNPDMGDRGAKELSEALRDDVCLKGERCH